MKFYGILLALLLAFIYAHLPAISLHYFWDEAWVYAPAVKTMIQNGPSLLPDAIPSELSRGHPLFFHFLYGVIGKFIGQSEVVLHSLSVIISCLVVWQLYATLIKITNQPVALLCAVFIMTIPVFFAQATLVLPEVLLSLLAILSIRYYLEKRYTLFLLFSSLGLLTKETFLTVMTGIIVNELIKRLKKIDELNHFSFTYLLIPFLPVALFFALQYLEYGWVFYPEHIDMMNYSFKESTTRFFDIMSWIFIKQNRFLFTIPVLLLCGHQVLKNGRSFIYETPQIAKLTFLIILFFALFSSVNFFSIRYITLALPLMIICGISVIYKTRYLRLFIVILVISAAGSTHSLLSSKLDSPRDISIAFWEYVPVQKEVVNFIEDMEIYDQPIYSSFMLHEYLKEPKIGYRNNEETFSHLTTWRDYSRAPEAYYIFSSLEPKDIYEDHQ